MLDELDELAIYVIRAYGTRHMGTTLWLGIQCQCYDLSGGRKACICCMCLREN